MQILLFLALAAAPPIAAPPAGWTLLIGDENARTHYDPASIRSAGDDLMRLHIVSNLAEPSHDAVRFDVELVVRCRARTTALLAASMYDAAGTLLGSRETDLAEAVFEPIRSPSVEERAHAIVCRDRG
ncbi:MAG TPA: surface-adhesin E family protein [Allosphingosinicella sp.]|nr:surface-adhesin E family protein [Allosphingosinicella sp.]